MDKYDDRATKSITNPKINNTSINKIKIFIHKKKFSIGQNYRNLIATTNKLKNLKKTMNKLYIPPSFIDAKI